MSALEPRQYLGLLYNLPLVQSLRVLEIAAGVALLVTPEHAEKYIKEVGIDTMVLRDARSFKGLRSILGG